MNETNFDWDDLRLFLAVARKGGLSPAASLTGKSAPTLGRRMLELERRLGRDLFRRLPRGYELTREGQDFLTKALELERKIDPLLSLNPTQSVPVVKISAGLWVTHLLCGKAQELAGKENVRLRFIAADEILDIGRREALIGIRNKRPEGIGLAGRLAGTVQFAIYAVDPAIKTWAQVIGTTPSAQWVQSAKGSDPTIEVTSSRNAVDLALAGSARVVLPTFVASTIPALKQVSPNIADLQHDQWLVTHHEDRYLPEVRGVLDRIWNILKSSN